MALAITLPQALTLINALRGTRKQFRVKFKKRSDGSLREMRCRFSEAKGKPRYDAQAKRLLVVWEVGQGYKSINLDGLLSLTISGAEYTISDDATGTLPASQPVEQAQFVFVRYSDNWADEMDVAGFHVFTKGDYDAFRAKVEQARFPKTHYLGTNEEIEYDEASDFLRCLRVRNITKAEYDAFLSLFQGAESGFWYDPTADGDDE